MTALARIGYITDTHLSVQSVATEQVPKASKAVTTIDGVIAAFVRLPNRNRVFFIGNPGLWDDASNLLNEASR